MFRAYKTTLSFICLVLVSTFTANLLAQRSPGTGDVQAAQAAERASLQVAAMTTGPSYGEALRRLGLTGINPLIRMSRPDRNDLELNPLTLNSLSASYTTGITYDDDLDVETTMVSLVLYASGAYRDHSVWGYIKYDDSSQTYRNYASAYKTGDQSYTPHQMEVPQGYARSFDPVLTANVLTTGVEPGRVYYVGELDQGNPAYHPSAVSIQWSDDGGFTWDDLVEIDRSDTDDVYLDKPDATVSLYSGTRGYVYVCYSKLQVANPFDPDASQIMVTRSEDGGETWEDPVAVVEGRVHTCQIAHSVSYNRVYLSWMNWDDDTIEYATSDDEGDNWSSVETAADAWVKGPYNREMDNLPYGLMTIPQMRFDSVNNQVELVWHECEYGHEGSHTGSNNSSSLTDAGANFTALGVQAGDYVINESKDAFAFVSSVVSSTTLALTGWFTYVANGETHFDTGDNYTLKAKDTDIYFVRKTGAGWQSKVRLDVPLGNDQFMPSIDFGEDSDELVIGYLDRSDDTSNPNRDYVARWIETDASGDEIDSGRVDNYFYSNPLSNALDGWIGDYTDTWFWSYSDAYGSRWHFVFPGKAASYWDIYASAIQ